MLVNTSGSATLTAVIPALFSHLLIPCFQKQPKRAMCITYPSPAGMTNLERLHGAPL